MRQSRATARPNKALHQTRREGAPAPQAVVEARLAGERRVLRTLREPNNLAII